MLSVCCTQRAQPLQLAVKMDGVFSCKLSCFAVEVSSKEDGGRSKHLPVLRFTFSLFKEVRPVIVRPVIATPVSSHFSVLLCGGEKVKGGVAERGEVSHRSDTKESRSSGHSSLLSHP